MGETYGKKNTTFLLLLLGSIITFIFGIDVVRLAFLLPLETGGRIVFMAVGVIIITTIIFPILIIIFDILSIIALDDNKNAGIAFGFIILILCFISIIFCVFYIIVVGLVPGDVANIIARIRGSLAVCIVGQILVLVGAILNLGYQFNK